MSEPENFLSRWSRRKQEAEHPPSQQEGGSGERTATERQADVGADASAQQPGGRDKPEPEFDVSSLPPIDSIESTTDIRTFLQKGVPQELTRAALRRAWTTDPGIRDFIEVAENQWDFATGSNLPGFGPLLPTDDVRRLVAEVFEGTPKLPVPEPQADVAEAGQSEQVSPANRPDLTASADDGSDREDKAGEHREAASPAPAAPEAFVVHRKEELVAMQQDSEKSERQMPARRTHGRALPQ